MAAPAPEIGRTARPLYRCREAYDLQPRDEADGRSEIHDLFVRAKPRARVDPENSLADTPMKAARKFPSCVPPRSDRDSGDGGVRRPTCREFHP